MSNSMIFVNKIKILARNIGLMPLIRSLAHKALGLADYVMLHRPRAPESIWASLANRPFRTVLDVGACCGGYAETILQAHFPDAIIHSFEPLPVAFAALEQVAARSGGRIIAHNFGLGERAETLTLHSTVDLLPASSLLAVTETNNLVFPATKRTEDLKVEIRVLDDVAPTLVPPIADDFLIKIDVQGFEDRVIRGGRQTLMRARVAIIEIQVVDLYSGQPSFRDIFLEMDGLGFAFVGVLDQYAETDSGVLYFDALFMRDQQDFATHV